MEREFISTMTSKGQTTVPKDIRDRLHLTPGQPLRWTLDVERGEVRLAVPEPAENPFQAVLGIYPLPEGLTTEQVMADLRGEPDPLLREGPGARVVTFAELRAQRRKIRP